MALLQMKFNILDCVLVFCHRVHPEMEILSITHLHVVPNLYDFCSVQHQSRNLYKFKKEICLEQK